MKIAAAEFKICGYLVHVVLIILRVSLRLQLILGMEKSKKVYL